MSQSLELQKPLLSHSGLWVCPWVLGPLTGQDLLRATQLPTGADDPPWVWGALTDWGEGTAPWEEPRLRSTQAGRALHARAWLPSLNTASNPVQSTSQPLAVGNYLNVNSLKCISYSK